MTEEQLQSLPSNAFFDFIKENYNAIYEFIIKIFKTFNVDIEKYVK